MACGGSETGPATEGGGIEAIGTAALTEEIPQLFGWNRICFRIRSTEARSRLRDLALICKEGG